MKIERTKNATKNIIFGMILKIYQVIVPFLMRTALIHFLGLEYVGLNGLFTSILQVLNLAELGVGSAMIFSMYKPIANDDNKTICALINLYKKYYRIIGLVIFILGMMLCPIIPLLIKKDLPEGLNIYVLYILNLSATAFSYWLFAYKNSLLKAHQRDDVISKITLVVNTLQYLLQFFVIVFFKNYYLYVIIILISQIITNIVTAIVSTKIYPKYKAIGKLDKKEIKKINQKVKDLFIAKVGGIIIYSIDSIIISAFLGLTILGIYQNYYYILTALIGIIDVIFNSCTAGMGNSLIVETKEKNYKDLRKFTFLIMTIASICSAELLCLYQPFMEWWVGKEFLVNLDTVILLCLYFFIYEENKVLCTYKDAAGIWHSDRFRPLIIAIVNLILDFTLVNIIGIAGVLLATVISIGLIGFPWLLIICFKEIFKTSPKEYLMDIFEYVVVTIIISLITYNITKFLTGITIILLILRAIIVLVISIFIIFIFFRKKEVFADSLELVKRILKLK